MFNFEIDKLTNSIEHAITGEFLETKVLLCDTWKAGIINKKDWQFDWKKEYLSDLRQVYKLVTDQDPKLIQGLISLTINQDHIYMHLIENANFNKGKSKRYLGVAGKLIAFACKLGFEKGFDGIVVFESKTRLITHYQQSLGAKILAGNRMFIDSKESLALVNRYFK